MKVLLVGGGGREDALAWALLRSPRLVKLRVCPGNAGTARRGENVAIDAADVEALVRHARAEAYDLVVVGPEAPLVAGLADRLRQTGIAVFGPTADGARIEGSKVFAKEFMHRHGIPTAAFRLFDDPGVAERYLRSDDVVYPLVVKADGLAAGKGVILADGPDEAMRAIRAMLVHAEFGAAGSRVVIEERLSGREVSFFVLSDGTGFVELATCQDYKRALDDDLGPNTGGMGAYSPSVYLDDAVRLRIVDTIVRPTIDGLAADGSPYCGVLYVGVMLTEDGPRVLEYNARFGDPETQALLPRLDGDWLSLLHDCARGELDRAGVRFKDDAAVCVVMTADGYPGSYETGRPISGLDAAAALEDVVVFHAGTATRGKTIVTAGGRVLGVTALGRNLAAARERAYEAVARIGWDGERHRGDIARDAVERIAQGAGA